MKCVICKVGNTRPGRTSVTVEREGTTIVFKSVPAEVCDNCGEAYVAEEVSRRVLAAAEYAVRSGVLVGVQELAGAAM
jgi:YgiT-type zinc finger domain-containing protein